MVQDKITLQRIQTLHPKLRAEATAIYQKAVAALTGNATVRFAFTLRTFAEQNAIYAQGRTKPGKIVTMARGGSSYHNYGLAIDIVLLVDKDRNGTYEEASWDTLKDFDGDKVADWMEVVKIFQSFGWEWGGTFKSIPDPPHFQKTFGFSVSQLLTKYNSKQLTADGYVKL